MMVEDLLMLLTYDAEFANIYVSNNAFTRLDADVKTIEYMNGIMIP